jgi:methyl-accepting chemotaxis protein
MDAVSSVIAAAVEQQSTTTREIATNVQAVTGATVRSSQAMSHVVVVADQAGTASQEVLTGAADIGHEAETLHTEVDRFLAAVRTDSGDRRRFERIDGGTVTAMLQLPGQGAIQAKVIDLSMGGVALLCNLPVAVGAEVSVELPEAGGAVTGRVVRAMEDALDIEFRVDDSTASRVTRAIQVLSNIRRVA